MSPEPNTVPEIPPPRMSISKADGRGNLQQPKCRVWERPGPGPAWGHQVSGPPQPWEGPADPQQQSGERDSFSVGTAGPGEEQPSRHSGRWPRALTGLSLGGGARSPPARSPWGKGDGGVGAIPEGWAPGPPRAREAPRPGEERVSSAPSQVCCRPDSACCQKSAPPYLEPCS